MRRICVLAVALVISGITGLPQDRVDETPWLATPIIARVTKIDADGGRVFYAWCALEPGPAEVVDGITKKSVREIHVANRGRTGTFDLTRGLVLNKAGKTINSRNALEGFKVGDTVLVVFCNTILEISAAFPSMYLEAIGENTKILVHQVPDQRTIREYYGERITNALIGENP